MRSRMKRRLDLWCRMRVGGGDFLSRRQCLCTIDKVGVNLHLVTRSDKHHLGTGDFENVAGFDMRPQLLLDQDIVETNAIAAVDPYMPATFVGRVFCIVEDGGVMARDNLTRAKVDVNRQRVFEVGNGTGGTIDRRAIIRRSSKVDGLVSHKVGPVATGDFGICRDLLGTVVLFLVVGVLDTGNGGIFGDGEVGNDRVDQIGLRNLLGLIVGVGI